MRNLGNHFEQSVSLFTLLILLIFSAIYYTAKGSTDWLGSNILACTAIILAATGQTFVLLTKGVDLSVEGNMALAGCLIYSFAPNDIFSLLLCLLLIIIIGAIIGLINGYFISKLDLPSYLVTFATLFITNGIAKCITPIKISLNEYLKSLIYLNARGYLIALVVILAIVFFWIYLKRTYFGLSLYAIEQNQVSAYNYGINVIKTRTLSYILSGIFSSLAGVFIALQTGFATPKAGESYFFLTLCAALLGGTYITGGKGNVLRTIAGCLALQLFISLVLSWGIPIYWAKLLRSTICLFMIAIQVYSVLIKGRTKRRSIDEYSIH